MSKFERHSRTHDDHLIKPAKPDRAELRPVHAGNPVPAQQRAVSNQTAQRFAQSCPLRLPSPSVCPFGGVCHACPVQAKLKVNAPGDKYEQEADRVADQVMRMPEPRIQRQVEQEEEEEPIQAKPLAAQITPLVQRQVEPEDEEEEEPVQAKLSEDAIQRQGEAAEEEEDPLQAKMTESAQVQRQAELEEDEGEEEKPIQTNRTERRTPRIGSSLQTRIKALRGGGRPLPELARRFFEPRFGCDFGQVRVHTGTQAEGIAYTINAEAFTWGRDIVFGSGQYTPETSWGRRLLAHELTHILQQNEAAQTIQRRSESLPEYTWIVPVAGGNYRQAIKTTIAMYRAITHLFPKAWAIIRPRSRHAVIVKKRRLLQNARQSYAVAQRIILDRLNNDKVLRNQLRHSYWGLVRMVYRTIRLPLRRGVPPTMPSMSQVPSLFSLSSLFDNRSHFCKPYLSCTRARVNWHFMRDHLIPYVKRKFGSEVRDLWWDYLHPKKRKLCRFDPKTKLLSPLGRRGKEDLRERRVFSSPSSSIVQGFVKSASTEAHQKDLVDQIEDALGKLPQIPFAAQVPRNSWTRIPVNRFLRSAVLNSPIKYKVAFEIPGHIAGGVGKSDAGDDTRSVYGNVFFFRRTDGSGNTTSVTMRTDFKFVVQDALDFCHPPGDPGLFWEQRATIPLSRLEASGFAYDVPFEVRFKGPVISRPLNWATIYRFWPRGSGMGDFPAVSGPSRIA